MKLICMGFFLLLFVILSILYCLKRLYSLINNDELFTTALVEGYAVDWRTNDSKCYKYTDSGGLQCIFAHWVIGGKPETETERMRGQINSKDKNQRAYDRVEMARQEQM